MPEWLRRLRGLPELQPGQRYVKDRIYGWIPICTGCGAYICQCGGLRR